VSMPMEGWFFGQAQERSSVDSGQGLKGSCTEKAGPHSLQCVSEGETKVSATPSGGVPRRGVQRGAMVACNRRETRRVESGSSLEIRLTNRWSKIKKDGGEDQRTST